jgi:hypothetical protein
MAEARAREHDTRRAVTRPAAPQRRGAETEQHRDGTEVLPVPYRAAPRAYCDLVEAVARQQREEFG